jgi:hypothetical protein
MIQAEKNNLMRITKYILLFVLIIFCFSDCKKYSDDERRYWFYTPKCRILYNGGGWQLESVFVDGVDSGGVYCKTPPPAPACPAWNFGNKENKDNYVIGHNEGHWSFSNKKNNIIIKNEGGNGLPPLFISPQGTSQEWQIEKLTKKEFWIKTNYNGKEYYLKMSK